MRQQISHASGCAGRSPIAPCRAPETPGRCHPSGPAHNGPTAAPQTARRTPARPARASSGNRFPPGSDEDLFEVKRQRHEREALRAERAHRGHADKENDRPAKQIDRQHRRRMVDLPPQSKRNRTRKPADFSATRRLRSGAPRCPCPASTGQRQTPSAAAPGIEAVRAPASSAAREADKSASRPNGTLTANSHGHDPSDRITEAIGRPDRKGGRDHHRIDAKAAAQQPARINKAHQGRIDAHQSAGADALQHARATSRLASDQASAQPSEAK